MATTADYLNKLVEQKNTLADNLVTKGVTATHDETLETLVPKVLEISGGSSGSTGMSDFSIIGYNSTTLNFDKSGWVGEFIDGKFAGFKINRYFSYTNSWEIMINFIITNSNFSSDNFLFASSAGFYVAPAIVLKSLSSIYSGHNTNSTASFFNKELTLTPSTELELNKEYYLRYSWSLSTKILKLELSEDSINWNDSIELSDVERGYQQTKGGIQLGGWNSSSSNSFKSGKINILKSYIKLDDEVVWGNET